MDERLLNDLLECSVCLERLDTSSRVLPCQHTFCLKCLKEIVEAHGSLRCPECRVAVPTPLDELPPNVLLMRILEGVRNKHRRDVQMPPQHGGGAASTRHADVKQIPHARALYDYEPKEQGDLSFKKGDLIQLLKRVDASWYRGESGGRVGIFPVSYVQVLVALPMQPALCKALYDFKMTSDEEGCLAFDKGAVITVLRRVDENWAEGRLDGRVGILPLAFVELNVPARELLNTHGSAIAGRAVPLAPDHRPQAQPAIRQQQMALSTPLATHSYQHIAMSQSHPVYHQPAVSQGPQTTTTSVVPVRHEPMMDLIQFSNVQNKSAVQSLTRISYDNQLRAKYDYSTTPAHKNDKYQPKRQDYVATFNNSSDSSSTPSISVSTSAPNTTSNSSSDSTEPSSPTSPEHTETTTLIHTQTENLETPPRLNSSRLNDSSGSKNERLNDSSSSRKESSRLNDSSSSRNESSPRANDSLCSTNTSLNVSLPPIADLPSCSIQKAPETTNETPKKGQENPSSSKNLSSYRPSGDLMSFALGPHGMVPTNSVPSRHHRDREKRNSLTPGSHLQIQSPHANVNRHSAEVCGVSAEGERRRRRSRSGERAPLPAAYVALYSYRPRKPDELELKKGCVYTVTERCQDGWYKGCSTRSQRCGVFPGNYVAPACRKHEKQVSPPALTNQKPAPPAAPDAPPRTDSPPLQGQPHSFPWASVNQPQPKSNEKSKERCPKQDKTGSGVSLMKRLAARRKCRSPPGVDNPVFEDCRPQPSHVRSGSCPSQLLQTPPDGARPARNPRDRADRPAAHKHRGGAAEGVWGASGAGPGAGAEAAATHRKSQSLDASAARDHRKHGPPLNERFRCVVPYPPNSEYELELRVDDVVLVQRKRPDGWYRGTLERTGRTGLFPASFVLPV